MGFAFAVISMVVTIVFAWKSFDTISANNISVTEKAVTVNAEMREVSENIKRASKETAILAGLVELKLLPSISANSDDMSALEEIFNEISRNISTLSEKKGLSADDYRGELAGIMDLIEGVSLPVVQGVKENTKASAVRMEEMTKTLKELDAKLKSFVAKADSASAASGEIVNESNNATDEAISTKQIMVYASTVIVVLILLVSYIVGISISRPLKIATGYLEESAGYVHSASGKISGSSQSLADGATNQASSLEESSESLKEIAEVANRNSDSAKTANMLMEETMKSVAVGVDSMSEMVAAMDSIKDSSSEISKIIKVIEEIAFQTNLLALNAAVEAARAGEHGKGFAVVAEEVRNLAQRSANASKDTADLIQNAATKSEAGTLIVKKSSEALDSITGSAKKVADLLKEISEASHEQATGINSVNSAFAQIDQVTKSNSSNAMESATASEELSAQSEYLQLIVHALNGIIQGTNKEEIDHIMGMKSGQSSSGLLTSGDR